MGKRNSKQANNEKGAWYQLDSANKMDDAQ